MDITHVSHPLVEHKLSLLRQTATPSSLFRALVNEIVTILAVEATRDLPLDAVAVTTPLMPMEGRRLADHHPLFVPILRAGLGMVDGFSTLVPTAEIGFLGMRRDDATLEVEVYANRLPEDLRGRRCFVVDPMLATGHSLGLALDELFKRGAKQVTALCILAAPEGVDYIRETFGDRDNLSVYLAGIDEGLNDQGYILPGLGDAGDRLYGVVD